MEREGGGEGREKRGGIERGGRKGEGWRGEVSVDNVRE